MRRQLFLILVAIMTFSQVAGAATMVSFHNNVVSGPSRIMLEGPMARLDLVQDDSYLLVDSRKSMVYMVMPGEKQIIELSTRTKRSRFKQRDEVTISLQPISSGPEIASFPTHAYRYKANGQDCGTLFASDSAMRVHGMPQLLAAMNTLALSQRMAMGAFVKFIDVCQRANMSMLTHKDVIGVPMKILGRAGEKISEVNRIDANAVIPPGSFKLPATFEKVSMFRALSRLQGF